MKTVTVLPGLLTLVASFQFNTQEKAPSLAVNCGCQCSEPALTFLDGQGRVQGNCRSADSNGGVWCYVDSGSSSSCRDLRPSSRFPSNPWSYEACTTPALPNPACPEPLCRGAGCPSQQLCRHLGNCEAASIQPVLHPIHLPIIGAITGAILGALGGQHLQPVTTAPPPITVPTTTAQPATKPTVIPVTTTTTTAATTTTTRSTLTTTSVTTTTTSTTTTQAPNPWLNQITINPTSNLVQGVWGGMELCPTSTYATAFQLLVAPLCQRRCLLDDDIGLMGVRLLCTTLPSPAASPALAAAVTSSVAANITRVGGGSLLGYGWSSAHHCPRNTLLAGARLLSEFFILDMTVTLAAGVPTPPGCPPGAICRPASVENSDPAGGLNLDMKCNDGTALPGPGIPERPDISAWTEEKACPAGSAVCGLRTKIHEGEVDRVSNLGVTDLMLQCCELPAGLAAPPTPGLAPKAPGRGGAVVFG